MVEITPDGSTRYTADDYTDEEIEGQAEYLALNTSLTKPQAEALLRDDLKGDNEPQKKIADDMGISQSTLSGHLSNAREKTENKNAFKMGVMFGGRSPLDPTTYRTKARQDFMDDGFIEVYRNEFPDVNKFAPMWAVAIVRPGESTVDEEYVGEDDVRLQMRWNVDYYHFDTDEEMVTTLNALVERKHDVDAAVVATALSKAGVDTDAFEDEVAAALS